MKDVIVRIIAPLILLMLAVPLILGKIPRNYFYGFRTCCTLSSDRVWYPANRALGVALACAAVVWLLAGLMVPSTVPPEDGFVKVLVVGLVALGVAVAVPVIVLWRIPK